MGRWFTEDFRGSGALAPAVVALAASAGLVGVLGSGAAPWSVRAGSADVPAATAQSTAVRARVVVHVGRSRVDPVVFGGRAWTLAEAEQFGWGGGVGSITWQGTGVMELVSAGHARYRDDGGAVLNLYPSSAGPARVP